MTDIPVSCTFQIKSALLIPVTYTKFGWLSKAELEDLV